jgi:hypothetical protein
MMGDFTSAKFSIKSWSSFCLAISCNSGVMKKAEKTEIIAYKLKQRFKRLTPISEQILISFSSKHIHAFRVDVKKCKALNRLLGAGLNKKKKYRIPSQLKKIYKELGLIRNFRMQEKKIKASPFIQAESSLEKYLRYVRESQDSHIQAVKAIFGGHKRFKPDRPALEYHKNKKAGQITINKFNQDVTKELIDLIRIENKSDEEFHNIRKVLKDIQYTWKFIKYESTGVTAFLSDKKEIIRLTEHLGKFHDLSVAIKLMETDRLTSLVTGNERDSLLVIRNKWNEEKEERRRQLQTMISKKFEKQIKPDM